VGPRPGLDGPQGRSGRVRKISPPPGFDPRTVQLVASRSTDYAIPAHQLQSSLLINYHPFVEPEGSFSCSQMSVTGPHHEPVGFSLHPYFLFIYVTLKLLCHIHLRLPCGLFSSHCPTIFRLCHVCPPSTLQPLFPRVSTRLPLADFVILVKIGQKYRLLYMKT
jgi:hypothetical protein